ncbi:hypothetical protein K438DRAFT_1474962, partial [Mycena galopus ATCC 62051]
QKSQLSWWPKPNVWAAGNLYPGWWSPQCEEWYQRRLAQIEARTVKLLNPKKWK